MRESGVLTIVVGGAGCTMLMGRCTRESGWMTKEVERGFYDCVSIQWICILYGIQLSFLLHYYIVFTLLSPSANGNRYEGLWSRGMKNGEGNFFYMDRGQVYTGDWVDDIAKCGTLEDTDRDTAPNAPPYPIPAVSDHETASFE